MNRSFHFHRAKFDETAFGLKCIRNAPELAVGPKSLNLHLSKQVDPKEFFETELTANKKTADKNRSGKITSFDVGYHNLSEAGKENEIERLRSKQIDYFIFIYEAVYEDETKQKFSVLVEDRGQSANNATSLYVDEITKGEVDISE